MSLAQNRVWTHNFWMTVKALTVIFTHCNIQSFCFVRIMIWRATLKSWKGLSPPGLEPQAFRPKSSVLICSHPDISSFGAGMALYFDAVSFLWYSTKQHHRLDWILALQGYSQRIYHLANFSLNLCCNLILVTTFLMIA